MCACVRSLRHILPDKSYQCRKGHCSYKNSSLMVMIPQELHLSGSLVELSQG